MGREATGEKLCPSIIDTIITRAWFTSRGSPALIVQFRVSRHEFSKNTAASWFSTDNSVSLSAVLLYLERCLEHKN